MFFFKNAIFYSQLDLWRNFKSTLRTRALALKKKLHYYGKTNEEGHFCAEETHAHTADAVCTDVIPVSVPQGFHEQRTVT